MLLLTVAGLAERLDVLDAVVATLSYGQHVIAGRFANFVPRSVAARTHWVTGKLSLPLRLSMMFPSTETSITTPVLLGAITGLAEFTGMERTVRMARRFARRRVLVTVASFAQASFLMNTAEVRCIYKR